MDSYMHKSSQNRINHPAIFVGIHQQENLTCFDPSPYYVFQKHFSGIETWKKKTDLAFANMFEEDGWFARTGCLMVCMKNGKTWREQRLRQSELPL